MPHCPGVGCGWGFAPPASPHEGWGATGRGLHTPLSWAGLQVGICTPSFPTREVGGAADGGSHTPSPWVGCPGGFAPSDSSHGVLQEGVCTPHFPGGGCRWGFAQLFLHGDEAPCTALQGGVCTPGCTGRVQVGICPRGHTQGIARLVAWRTASGVAQWVSHGPVAWREFAPSFPMSCRVGELRMSFLHVGFCMPGCMGEGGELRRIWGVAWVVCTLWGVIPSPGGSGGRRDVETGALLSFTLPGRPVPLHPPRVRSLQQSSLRGGPEAG